MTTLRQAARQALEALENIDKAMPFPVGKKVITALREALAQPEQEPVADRAFLERVLVAMEGVIDVADRKTDEFDALRSCIIELTLMLYTTPPAAPVQEPHKGLSEHMAQATNGRVRIDPVTGDVGIGTLALQTSQRTWVGLTPEEVQFCALKHRQLVNAHYDSASDTNIITAAFEATVFYKTVEQALKERNG